MQLAMCVGTALLGLLLLVWGGSSDIGLFGWLFVALGALGTLFWFLVKALARIQMPDRRPPRADG